MDSFEFNKIMGALLFTCLVTLTANIAAGAIFTPKKLEKPGYEITIPDAPAPGGAPAAPAEPEVPVAVLLAKADSAKGEASAKKCATCHTFSKGEPNRVGPNLYGVLGRPKASAAGFNYSAAMKAKGGEWTFEELSHFLANPKAFVPGTTMSFAGVSRGGERADIMTFLNAKSDKPLPLPQAAEAPAQQKTQ